MGTKKPLTILGVILIIIQIVSFIGMSNVRVGLYPDNDDLAHPSYNIDNSGLNLKKALFAIEAGIDRFKSSFEDLTYGEYTYRVMTSTQMASAMVRESLGCSEGGSIGLAIYDTILTISYLIVGLLGIGIMFAPKIVGKTNDKSMHEEVL